MKIIIKNIERNLLSKPIDIIEIFNEDSWYNTYEYENGEYLQHSEVVNDINNYSFIIFQESEVE